MKNLTKIFIILFIAIGTTGNSQSHDKHFFNVGFNQDTDFNIYTFLDPTLTDDGVQIGIGFKKEFNWFFVGTEFSTYQKLNPSYYDAMAVVGTTINIKRFDIIGAFRYGLIFREGNGTPFPMVGIELSFVYHVTDKISLGARLGVDHREDQENQFFGDSDAHEPGLIFTGKLSQENGAFLLIYTIN